MKKIKLKGENTMSIGEVINMLVAIYNFLSKYIGEIFGKKEETPEENADA